jgi:ribonuclease P protein component
VARSPYPNSNGRSFPKSARLLRPADYERVYENGMRHTSRDLMVLYLQRDDDAAARVGLTVGRALGGAVVRNRMKRRLREAVRMHRGTLPGAVDVVLHPRKPALKTESAQLAAEVQEAFQAIRRKLNP